MADSNVICTLLCFTLAEFFWRFGRVIIECIYFFGHYNTPKLWTICVYSFTFSYASAILLICIALYTATQCHDLINIITGIWKRKTIIITILLLRLVSFDKSTLHYSDLIRSDCGIDYATGMASSYFHGFLKLTLPSLDDKTGIRDRILNYEEEHKVRFAVKRLFILIPSSLHTSRVLQSDIMQQLVNNSLEVKKDRAGVNRRYTNAVYRISIDGVYYCICAEGATPLLSYLESMNSHITTTWQMKAMQTEITHKFYFYLKKILSKYNETLNQVELVYYNDASPDAQPIDVGEVLVAHIKRVWEQDETESKNRIS